MEHYGDISFSMEMKMNNLHNLTLGEYKNDKKEGDDMKSYEPEMGLYQEKYMRINVETAKEYKNKGYDIFLRFDYDNYVNINYTRFTIDELESLINSNIIIGIYAFYNSI